MTPSPLRDLSDNTITADTDAFNRAVDFIRANAMLPPRRVPGKKEIIFVGQPGVNMFDLEDAIRRVGGNPQRNADQDISVTGDDALRNIANLRIFRDFGNDFNYTGADEFGTVKITR